MPNLKSPVVEQPADRSFHDPTMPVASQFSSVLAAATLSPATVRANEFDITLLQSVSEPVSIGRSVVDQAFDWTITLSNVNQRFDRIHLGHLSTRDECGNRNALSVDHHHDLAALATFRLANVSAPFFAGEKVPSPIACDQCSSFRRSIRLSSRRHAFSMMPASVHSLCRRQHVEADGYRSGKSCHRAPDFSTQMMPSRQGRGPMQGRPPALDFFGFGKRSLMRFH